MLKETVSEYARAGVNYKLLEPFKRAMIEVARKTVTFPNKRGVYIDTSVLHAHGGIWSYRGRSRHEFCNTLEGLGNAGWVSELLYQDNPHGSTGLDIMAYANAMMAVNDNLAQGALPIAFSDEVAASDSEYFKDKKRVNDIKRGTYEACRDAGMALVGGESPVYKYLLNPRPPVKSVASFGGHVTGIIAPVSRKITGKLLGPGDCIIALASSGIHVNGYSLLIRRVMGDSVAGIPPLEKGFNTKLPSGMTIGQACHLRTLCYVRPMEALFESGVKIHALLPGTGDGVGKLSFDNRRFRYRIHSWFPVPELFLYLLEIGVSFENCLKTFNMGAGYYIFVSNRDVNRVLAIVERAGFKALEVGVVERGKRCTVWNPPGYPKVVLPPPGE